VSEGAGGSDLRVVEVLVAGWLDVGCPVHALPQVRELEVDGAAGAVLAAQRAMSREGVPRVVRQVVGEGQLAIGVETFLVRALAVVIAA
jgi:hypothetical protein